MPPPIYSPTTAAGLARAAGLHGQAGLYLPGGAESPFDPASLSHILRYDMAAGSMLATGEGAAGVGDNIATLADLDGSVDATQTTGTLQPVAMLSGADFDATDDLMAISMPASAAGTMVLGADYGTVVKAFEFSSETVNMAAHGFFDNFGTAYNGGEIRALSYLESGASQTDIDNLVSWMQTERGAGASGKMVMVFDGSDYVKMTLAGGTSDYFNKTVRATVKTSSDVTTAQAILSVGKTSQARIYIDGGTIKLGNNTDSGFVVSPHTTYVFEVDINAIGQPVGLRVDGSLEWTGTAEVVGTGDGDFYLGTRIFSDAGSLGLFFTGAIYDVSISGVSQWDGHGNRDADWEDQIGTNNGTVIGSPGTTFIAD